MRIGIDIDGTLNDLHKPWLELYVEKSGDRIRKENIFDYDISKFVLPTWEKKIFELLNTPNIFRNAPVQENAIESIKQLQDWGNEIYFISAFHPFYQSIPEKYQWLQEHFDFVDLRKAVFFCQEKHLIGVDVLIDDCFANIENRAMNQIDILFDQPWNHLNYFVNRAIGWQGVMTILEEFGARNGH